MSLMAKPLVAPAGGDFFRVVWVSGEFWVAGFSGGVFFVWELSEGILSEF